MTQTQYIAKTIVTPRDAIASHIRWKITLITAARVREGLSERATRSIQHPEECSIRQWLVSSHTLSIRHTPEYQAALDCHAAFHREMQGVARLLNSGDFDAARHLINDTGTFEKASSALANALMGLQRVSSSRIGTLNQLAS